MNTNPTPENWQRRTYVTGGVIGTIFGLIGAYLYARAAEEEAARNGGKPNSIPTGQAIGLALAAIALLRQVTELGKPAKK